MQEIKDKLTSWAAWVWKDQENLGYPRFSISVPYQQNYAYEHDKKADFISDEDAMQIGDLMAILKKRDEACWSVLHGYYLYGQDAVGTAQHHRISRDKVYRLLKEGERWMDGALCMCI